jgi:Raf kinase inhibitor-like YbhB/YbcL family protein
VEKIKMALPSGAWRSQVSLMAVIILFLQYAKHAPPPCQAAYPLPLSVTSSSFKSGGYMPSKFTADGANISPALEWSKSAANAKSYCLICNDPDAPSGNWIHWVAYDIPPHVEHLLENASATAQNFRQGVNSFNKVGWNGPAPPRGKVHRYVFTVFAVDTMFGDIGRVAEIDLKKRLAGHVLTSGQAMAIYKR